MKTRNLFVSMSDRYDLDTGICSASKGFAQVDTSQDAWYFGIWANPIKRKVVTYAEGDITIKTAESDEEFVQEIRELVSWHEETGHTFKGIDPGWDPEPLKSAFEALGLGDLLH